MQLEAICAVHDIQKVSIWSRSIKNAERFVAEISGNMNINVYKNISDAVSDADIICTATSSHSPLIHLNDIKPHVHINAVGSHNRAMQEISSDVLASAVVFADQLEAVFAESGEIFHAVENHLLTKEKIIEIGSWLLKKDENYQRQRTVFKSVGLAIQDISVAEVVFQNAVKNKFGTSFALR